MPKLLAVDMEQERSAASSVALNGGIFTKAVSYTHLTLPTIA